LTKQEQVLEIIQESPGGDKSFILGKLGTQIGTSDPRKSVSAAILALKRKNLVEEVAGEYYPSETTDNEGNEECVLTPTDAGPTCTIEIHTLNRAVFNCTVPVNSMTYGELVKELQSSKASGEISGSWFSGTDNSVTGETTITGDDSIWFLEKNNGHS